MTDMPMCILTVVYFSSCNVSSHYHQTSSGYCHYGVFVCKAVTGHYLGRRSSRGHHTHVTVLLSTGNNVRKFADRETKMLQEKR